MRLSFPRLPVSDSRISCACWILKFFVFSEEGLILGAKFLPWRAHSPGGLMVGTKLQQWLPSQAPLLGCLNWSLGFSLGTMIQLPPQNKVTGTSHDHACIRTYARADERRKRLVGVFPSTDVRFHDIGGPTSGPRLMRQGCGGPRLVAYNSSMLCYVYPDIIRRLPEPPSSFPHVWNPVVRCLACISITSALTSEFGDVLSYDTTLGVEVDPRIQTRTPDRDCSWCLLT